MPKVKTFGRIHSKAAALSASISPLLSKGEVGGNHADVSKTLKQVEKEENEDENNSNLLLSRGQRKRLAKREQYAKREKMILSSLRIQREEDQKKRIDGMDALKEALHDAMFNNSNNEIKEVNPTTNQVKTNSSKRSIAQREIEHMHLVLQHPSFVHKPFATMQEHLRNTFSVQATEEQRKADIVRKKEKELALEKKVRRKERIRDAKFDSIQGRQKLKRKRHV